jgi:MSHA biogenesis protein MshK
MDAAVTRSIERRGGLCGRPVRARASRSVFPNIEARGSGLRGLSLHGLAAVASLAVCLPVACAQDLADPMRPPPAMLAPPPGAPGEATAMAASGLVLQSVLVADDRRVAVIGGRTVRVGERVGTWRLVRVGDAEATLRGPEGTKVLKLWNGVSKVPATGTVAVSTAPAVTAVPAGSTVGVVPNRSTASPPPTARRADPRPPR